MSKVKKLLIITSDSRQKLIADYLKRLNYIIYENTEYVKGNFDAVILPMAYNKSAEIIESGDDILIIGGRFNEKDINLAREYNVTLYDYFESEYVKYENAFLTAEASVALAISNTNKSLKNSKCLITGFGRIGKMLSCILKGFGCDITVTARKDTDLAYIKSLGFKIINTQNLSDISKYDLIFNTIPCLVFDEDILKTHKNDVLIIDLASKPGGIDFKYAKENNINCTHALSLPSKYSPETDAEILSKSIVNILSERS